MPPGPTVAVTMNRDPMSFPSFVWHLSLEERISMRPPCTWAYGSVAQCGPLINSDTQVFSGRLVVASRIAELVGSVPIGAAGRLIQYSVGLGRVWPWADGTNRTGRAV